MAGWAAALVVLFVLQTPTSAPETVPLELAVEVAALAAELQIAPEAIAVMLDPGPLWPTMHNPPLRSHSLLELLESQP
jgi:hypothetical protein